MSATPEEFNSYLEELVDANPDVPRKDIEDAMVSGFDTGMEVKSGEVIFPNGLRLKDPSAI